MSIKAFSQKSLRFDHMPEDADLVWLLGDRDYPGFAAIVDTADLLMARPSWFPLRFVALCVALVVCAMTAAPWWISGDGCPPQFEGIYWVIMVPMWLVGVPAMIAVFGYVQSRIIAEPDFFRVEKQARRLDLCRLGRMLNANELIEFTLLSRHYCPSKRQADDGGWMQQIGVLVRAPDGAVEHLPVLHEPGHRLFQKPLIRKVAEIFDLPVRSVTLDWHESQRLEDS